MNLFISLPTADEKINIILQIWSKNPAIWFCIILLVEKKKNTCVQSVAHSDELWRS